MTGVISLQGLTPGELREWANRNPSAPILRKHLSMVLAKYRVLIHPAIRKSLVTILNEQTGVPEDIIRCMVFGEETAVVQRIHVAMALERLDPVFSPNYVPAIGTNPFATNTVGNYAWRALFFSIVRLQFGYDDDLVPTTWPEVNVYGEPMRALTLALVSALRPPEHREIEDAVREVVNDLTVSEFNRTARRLKPDGVERLANLVGLTHTIWGDRLFNPPL